VFQALTRSLSIAGLLTLFAAAPGCDAGSSSGTPELQSPFGQVSLAIHAEVPRGTRDMVWDVTLDAPAGADSILFPWSKRVTAGDEGGGYGLSVYGPCAAGATNTLTATFVGAYPDEVRAAGEVGDPAPAGALTLAVDVAPIVVDVVCEGGEETYVDREPSLVPAPVDLLDDPSATVGHWACAPTLGCSFSGDDTRLTLALTCAAPESVIGPQALALNEIVLVCDDEPVAVIDPSQDGGTDGDVAVSRTQRELAGGTSAQWAVTIDVATELLESATCRLQSEGTACDPGSSSPYFDVAVAGSRCSDGVIRAGAVHPYLRWDATVSRDGDVLCWNRDLGTDGIAAFYTAYDATEDTSFPYTWDAWR